MSLREAVVREAWSWHATPYHPHGRLKGVGVDCGNLLCAVYAAVGAIAPLDPGFYDTGWHLHRNEEMFVAFIARAGGREVERPGVGDMGVWRFGRTYSHGGIVVDDAGLVMHAYLDRGVIATRLSEEPLASRPVRFYTLWEGWEMAGGGTISVKANKIDALKLQSSTYGATVPAIFGHTRAPGNLLWYGGFTAHKQVKKQRAGKGGGTTVKNVTYTYTAHVAMALGEGQVLGVPRVWRGKDQYTGGIASSQIVTATETYAVPGGGGAKTLTNASGWRATIAVYYTGTIDVGDGTTSGPIYLAEGTDYTVAAGVYTFGAAWAGKTLSIEYQYLTGSLTQAGLAALGLTMFSGAIGQTTWSLLTSSFSAEAIPYSGLAYVAAQDYDLGDDAAVQNHNFEVQGRLAYHLGSAVPDADPAMVALAMLTEARYGALFPAARLNLSLWSRYCRAAGLLMSPAFTEQIAAAELIEQLARLTNTAPVWSAGALKMMPYGDTALNANGATYTPNVTPVYDLDDRHFLPRSGGGEPIAMTPRPAADAKNHVRIEFLDRAADFNVAIADAKDQADIDLNGLRSADILKAHWIRDRAVATKVAQLVLQRALYVRTEYEFKLPWTFALLEPMDIVTLTDSYLGLSLAPVRLLQITESEDGELDVLAEEFPAGIATASTYGAQGGSGYVANFNAAPGSVIAPCIFEAPAERTVTGLEVYAAVTSANANWGGCRVWVSLDGTSYNNVGSVFGGARYGTLTGAISGGNLPVQLNASEQLVAASAADATALTSLCYIGGSSPEYLAHQGATLTGPGAYTLAGLVRGTYGTSGTPAHATSDPFVRVDEAVAKSGPLELSMIGKTIYFKFTSFNIFGRGEQDLADVTQYSYVVTGAMARARGGNVTLIPLTADTAVGPDYAWRVNGASAWNTGAYSAEAYVGGAFATAVVTAGEYIFMGLDAAPIGVTIGTFDYAAYVLSASESWAFYYYENGVYAQMGTATLNDVLSVVYDGKHVRYLKNGTVLRTVAAAANLKLHFATLIYRLHAKLSNIRFGPVGPAGADGAAGANGADALSISATPDTRSIPCSSAGAPNSGELPYTITHTVLQGPTNVTASASYSHSVSNCSVTNNGGGSYMVNSVAADSGYLEVTASYGGGSVTKRSTFAKVYTGTAATTNTTSAVSVTASGTYVQIGGPLTLPVGPSGTVSASMVRGYSISSGPGTAMNVKFQYRTTPGSGGWTDFGSVLTGETAIVGEPSAVAGNATLSGPATPAVWEFQIVGVRSGSATLSQNASGRFSVSWA